MKVAALNVIIIVQSNIINAEVLLKVRTPSQCRIHSMAFVQLHSFSSDLSFLLSQPRPPRVPPCNRARSQCSAYQPTDRWSPQPMDQTKFQHRNLLIARVVVEFQLRIPQCFNLQRREKGFANFAKLQPGRARQESLTGPRRNISQPRTSLFCRLCIFSHF